MGSEGLPLRRCGIYRNLPTFDPSLKSLSAIVCGASGISGFNAMRALLSCPGRWSTIYALSRKPLSNTALQLFTPEQRACIKHVSVDFTKSADSIAKALQESQVTADYVFFYAYLTPETPKGAMHPDSAQDLIDANVPMLRNFLNALPLASLKPKRILLQTGGKSYGMHIGRVRTPLVESDPQPKHLAKNFYYHQEDLLFDYCKVHSETSWNIVRPFGVIGAAPNSVMTMMVPFAVCALVQREKSEPLRFGGDFASWQFEATHSSAQLTGFLSEWAVLEEKCADQAFNAIDGSPLSWDRFFHELARWFGVGEVAGPEDDDHKYNTLQMAGGKDAPLGYGPPLTLSRSFSLSQWAALSENKDTWTKIMQEIGESAVNPWKNNLQEAMFGDFAYLRFGFPSQNKVRRFGFSGFVDSLESTFEMYQDMETLGMLPPMQVETANPLV